jgi:pyruvate dehydrogenase E2 component (dihydrolipoamide acetyltransferase)
MPRLSDSMEEGTVVEWLVDDGVEVARGDELAEIETDKATVTYEADADGFLQHVVAEGETVAVGATIARLLGEDERRAGPPIRVKASPLARRAARALGVDLEALTGSGPGGRIVRADVEAAPQPAVVASPPPAPSPSPPPPPPRTHAEPETIALTSAQRTIARRMSDSHTTVPDFQVRTEVDVTQLLDMRRLMKAAGRAVSVNDFVVRACALALRDHPRANGAYRGDAFDIHAHVNVGVAVAGEGTLVVPTIADADAKPVTQIAEESRTLAGKVRDGTITPAELDGATFTVSNLGMFGVTSFTAVIAPGQAAILAVGAAVERPVVYGDEIVRRSIMDVSLSCDHRILYGADAASFLADLRGLLERPWALVS